MSFTNYPQSQIERYSNGFVSIAFRDKESEKYAINKSNFVCNSFNDTWFRKTEGVTKGYGLMIRDINITSTKTLYVGDFKAYKCTIKYEDNTCEWKIDTDKFWLFVHERFKLEDVLAYIETHKNSWIP